MSESSLSLERPKGAIRALMKGWMLVWDKVWLSAASCRDLAAMCALKLSQHSMCAEPVTLHRQMSSCGSRELKEVKQG